MRSSRVRNTRLIVAVAACAVLCGSPSAIAAPGFDPGGYVDSAARCASPATVVLFGSTETSRVAICKSPDGQFEYRGVRVRDGAKLVLSASQSGDGFTANNDGITYTVSTKSLVIGVGDKVIREEPMVDAHRPEAPAPTAAPPTTSTTPLPPPLPAEVGGR